MFFWYFIRGRFVNSVIGEFCINLNAEVDGVFRPKKNLKQLYLFINHHYSSTAFFKCLKVENCLSLEKKFINKNLFVILHRYLGVELTIT